MKVSVGSKQIGCIEIFCLLKYWVMFWTISSFMLNLFKYSNQKNQTIFIQKCINTFRPKYDSGSIICSQGPKCLRTPNLYTTFFIFVLIYYWFNIFLQSLLKWLPLTWLLLRSYFCDGCFWDSCFWSLIFWQNFLRRNWMPRQPLLYLPAAQASSFFIYPFHLLPYYSLISAHVTYRMLCPPNPCLEKQRISLGMTSVLRMYFCLHV